MDMTLPMTKAIAKASLANYAAVINDAHRAAFQSAQTAIEHARVAGEHLIKAKAALNHGEWLPWLAANVHVSEVQAQRYMRIAHNWTAVEAKSVAVTDLTLRGALDALAKPKVKDDSKPLQPKPEQPKSVTVTDLPVESEPPKPAKSVAPVEPVEVEKLRADLDEAHDRLAEMSTQQAAMNDELVFLQKVEDAGDKLAEALAEVKRLQAEVRILRERNNGLMNEKNEAVRAAKMWKAKFEKAERAAA